MNIHVTVFDIRHDVSKTREELGRQVRSVNTSPFHPIGNGKMLTVTRVQTRSATSTTEESSISHPYLVYLESPPAGAEGLFRARKSSASQKVSLHWLSSVQEESGKHPSL